MLLYHQVSNFLINILEEKKTKNIQYVINVLRRFYKYYYVHLNKTKILNLIQRLLGVNKYFILFSMNPIAQNNIFMWCNFKT